MAAKAPSSLVQGRIVAWVIIPTRAVIRAKASMGIAGCGVTKLLRSRGSGHTESVCDSVEHLARDFEQIGRDAGQGVDGLQLGTHKRLPGRIVTAPAFKGARHAGRHLGIHPIQNANDLAHQPKKTCRQ